METGIKTYKDIMVDIAKLEVAKELNKYREMKQTNSRGIQLEDIRYLEYNKDGKLIGLVGKNKASDFRSH